MKRVEQLRNAYPYTVLVNSIEEGRHSFLTVVSHANEERDPPGKGIGHPRVLRRVNHVKLVTIRDELEAYGERATSYRPSSQYRLSIEEPSL
ncbi:hypothetical protein U1Q18_010315 [Sarracenia purpurea var. burkii]